MNNHETDQKDITNETEKSSAKSVCCGIYKIVNKLNKKYYVGSSKDIFSSQGRWKKHIYALNRNRHHSPYLQRAWNKYGKESFEFLMVENVAGAELLKVEQTYLDIAKTERKMTYNVSFCATGGDCPPEAMEKIKRYWTEGKRIERSEKMMGINNPFYGKTHSQTIRTSCGNRFRGIKLSEEHKSKITLSGTENSATDKNIYVFQNKVTEERFEGLRIEFEKLHPELAKKVAHWARTGCTSLTGWSALPKI